MTIQQAWKQARQRLQDFSTTPDIDAMVLLTDLLQKPHSWLLAHGDEEISPVQSQAYDARIDQRSHHIPVAYITHHKEFYGRDFYVDTNVLIPRPETEGLIEQVLRYSRTHTKAQTIVEIGTGSGCIAVTLKKEIPHAHIIATDISPAALTVAQKNADTHNVEIEFVQGDIFSALPQRLQEHVDIIISNPPYVAAEIVDHTTVTDLTEERMTVGLQHEPRQALVPQTPSGEDAESAATILRIIHDAPYYLAPGGMLCMEIGYDHGTIAQQLAQKYFPDADIQIEKDLAGLDRILLICT